ncbi:MAG: DUF3500 domain-containing protein [Akkermansiaceae bacterium]|nr:DUF3500 domain-containing protein [Akkermansiaceae bacterium]
MSRLTPRSGRIGTSSQNNAKHIHTVWRDLAGDFGRDNLGEHYQGRDHAH